MTAWPRLRAWIDTDRELLRLRRRLAEGRAPRRIRCQPG
ncbi:hypothetical protein AB0G74_28285 [Streptomyces sp. NPDC020875]